jgi:hypothetical protein
MSLSLELAHLTQLALNATLDLLSSILQQLNSSSRPSVNMAEPTIPGKNLSKLTPREQEVVICALQNLKGGEIQVSFTFGVNHNSLREHGLGLDFHHRPTTVCSKVD